MYSHYKYFSTLLLVLVLVACQENKAPEILPQNETMEDATIHVLNKQFEASNFELGRVEQKSFPTTLAIFGKVQLPEKGKTSISSLLPGTVGRIEWIEGQWVSKGSTLFTVTNPELINMQEDFLVTQSQLSYLRKEYNRQNTLATENITTQKELLKTKSELTAIEARHSAIKRKLELYGFNTDQISASELASSINVTAPTSGHITDINIHRGAYLEPSTVALKLINTNLIQLELSVLEKDASKLNKGQKINFSTQNNPGIVYTATINLIHKTIDENGMNKITALIDDKTKKALMPGNYVKAQLELANQESLALPKDALVQINNDWYALQLISKDNTGYSFSQIKVDVGPEYNGYTSVTNLGKEVELMTKGAYFLIQ